MGGGLMQLVAYGAQDVYLTGNPQITFFKVVYRRHTNFSIEVIEHTFNGNPDFGRKVTICVHRNGDLVTKMYLRIRLSELTYNGSEESKCLAKAAWTTRLGHALIDNVELDIGGSRIDKQYGDWLNIWYELARNDSHDRGYDHMIGNVPALTELSGVQNGSSSRGNVIKNECTLFIPLQFWFNRNNGLALPLIALQYHEVRLHFEFRDLQECVVHNCNFNPRGAAHFEDTSLLIDYVYLDSEERRRFAQVGHEYLIEQVQFTGEEPVTSTNHKFRLTFNHPTKALIWLTKFGNYRTGLKFLAYSHVHDWEIARNEAAEKLILSQFYVNNDGSVGRFSSKCSDAPSGYVKHSNETSKLKVVPGPDIADIECPIDLFILNKCTPLLKCDKTGDLRDKVCGTVYLCRASNCPSTVDPDERFYLKVVVTRNDLTLRDLSKPTSAYSADNRNDFIKDQDVVVYQHHNYGLFIDGTCNPVTEALIQLNGHDRFDRREGAYFNYVQPWQHAEVTPADGVNMYSFALRPFEHQPSGTANLSRIDSTHLQLWFDDTTFGKKRGNDFLNDFIGDNSKVCIYGYSYNVLRIMSGMGGLAYSN